MAVAPKTPDECPVCGKEVPRNAVGCPACGADHKSGWREDAEAYDGVDLPTDDFDYEEFVAQEFGSGKRPNAIKPAWWITALLLIVAFLVLYLYSAFR